MKYAIVYSSRTGNTKLLSETVREILPSEDCIYFGGPDASALSARRIFLGFWTDKGSCDEQTAVFLNEISNQQIFLFGTAGFGGSQAYLDRVLKRINRHVCKKAQLIGSFMCQGKMPVSVRTRYENMLKNPVKLPNVKGMIENFDNALSHPDNDDLENLREKYVKVRLKAERIKKQENYKKQQDRNFDIEGIRVTVFFIKKFGYDG